MNRDIDVNASSGNVFADLGLPEPEVWLAKARLVHCISEIVEVRSWSNTQAANALGVDEMTVAALLDGDLETFSIERLFRFLNALGHEVELLVQPSRSPARPPGVALTTD